MDSYHISSLLSRSLNALQSIYGNFTDLSTDEIKAWTPPKLFGCHNGNSRGALKQEQDEGSIS